MSEAIRDDDEPVCEPLTGEVSFDPADNTAAAPFPQKFVLVLPTACLENSAGMTLMAISHPRHRESQMVAVSPTGGIYEVQEHQRKRFGEGGADAWFIGDSTVEPSSPLYIGSPMDPTFIALYLLMLAMRGPTGDGARYEDAYTLLGRDEGIVLLPPAAQCRIEEAFSTVSDVEMVRDNERFYRFSKIKCTEWLGRKHARLSNSAVLTQLCGEVVGEKRERSEGPSQTQFKASALISEYIDSSLSSLLADATGCNPSAPKKVVSSAQQVNTIRDELDEKRLEAEEATAKKKRIEANKSFSVKKLEKAGRPSGTPSLFAMFAKK